MDYYNTWVKLKDFVKASSKKQFEDVLLSIVKQENERSITQKRLYAESVIGENEDRGDPSYYGLTSTAVMYRREYRDELRAEQKARIK